MNTINAIDIHYLRPNLTIESVLLSNKDKERMIYIYNYQGWFYRVFDNIMDVFNFFNQKTEVSIHFENEDELDNYLKQLSF